MPRTLAATPLPAGDGLAWDAVGRWQKPPCTDASRPGKHAQSLEFPANSAFKPFGKLGYEGRADDRFRR